MPKVAVVIASYNTARHVGEAVQSVLDQTVSDLELVVIDDGSTDETAEAIEPYLVDSRLRFVQQENKGQASAKNRGIAESSAPIVGFCDADDFWDTRKLELQLPLFERSEVGVVYSQERQFTDGPGGRCELPYSPVECRRGRVTDALFIENFVPFGTTLVRRQCFEKSGAFDESLRMGIDWDLWLRLSLDWEFDLVDEVTYYYRVWEQQMSQNWRGRYRDAIRIMETFLERHPDTLSAKVVRRAWAHTFVTRGRLRVSMDREFIEGIKDVGRGILRDPAFVDGWKAGAWIGMFVIRSLIQHRDLRSAS